MSVIVTDAGFGPDTHPGPIVALADLAAHPDAQAVDLVATDPASALLPHLARLTLIRIGFAAFSDGRGFTLARDLRHAGFAGRLRAFGPLLADQYTMARRAGFDEVEIPDALAARQPQEQWRFRADWQAHDHRARLFV